MKNKKIAVDGHEIEIRRCDELNEGSYCADIYRDGEHACVVNYGVYQACTPMEAIRWMERERGGELSKAESIAVYSDLYEAAEERPFRFDEAAYEDQLREERERLARGEQLVRP